MKSKILSQLFAVLNFFLKIKNSGRKKILVYTDSRGYNVISKNGKTPFDSYVFDLCKKYRVDYFICTEKFTTIVDFVEKSKTLDLNSYEHIILHCGVVDFSPRPVSNIQKVRESKVGSPMFTKIFASHQEHYAQPFEQQYNNEDTITMYSAAYLENEINPQIAAIKNLIWIDSNNFVSGWDGNFTKGRPQNINQVVNAFDEIFAKAIKNRITLKNWSDDEIKKYTIDNIHFTQAGFDELLRLIRQKLEQTGQLQ